MKRVLTSVLLQCLLLSLFSRYAPADSSSRRYLNRILGSKNQAVGKSIRRMAKGTYLLPDNPANYALYEKMEVQLRSLARLVQNHGDMVSYYRYEAGILQEQLPVLQRIRELILRRSGGILSDTQRSLLNSEINQLYRQILFSLRHSDFNGKQVFKSLLASPLVAKRFTDPDLYTLGRVDALRQFFLKRITVCGAITRAIRHRIKTRMRERENKLRFQRQMDTDYGKEMTRLRKNHLQLLINLFLLKK